MKSTKKQVWAVKETIKQWQWYKDNPDAHKLDYFEGGCSNLIGNCFLCEYINCNQGDFIVGLCPLDTNKLNCYNEGSPFDIWWGNGFTRKKQCDRIISACKRWLKKYDF